jgi:hypothetical protein
LHRPTGKALIKDPAAQLEWSKFLQEHIHARTAVKLVSTRVDYSYRVR